jgi:hypothetical protein
MRQGWKILSLCAALAIAPIALPASHAASGGGKAAASKSSTSSSKSKYAYRQFTGVVTNLDKNSITVEKGGKNARTVVFTKHDEMKTTGDLEQDARVTVYYREDGDRAVAHRVVVKTAKKNGTKNRG